jgi:hypothetical protein
MLIKYEINLIFNQFTVFSFHQSNSKNFIYNPTH